MNLKIQPALQVRGAICPPTSKSYTIRAFIVAALGGKSRIINPSGGVDCQVAKDNCRRLGAKIKNITKNIYYIEGIGEPKKKSLRLDVKESGTTLRFLISLAALFPGKTIIDGRGTLRTRPNRPLIDVFKRMGLNINGTGKAGTIPIKVEGKKLFGGSLKIDGTLSSQFISSLLITCPSFSGRTHLEVIGDYIVSQPYIDMTMVVLNKAGVKIRRVNSRNYDIPGNQKFRGLGKFIIPTDYGLAAFFMAAASLVHSDIYIKGVGSDNLVQADKKILYFLRRMGVKFVKARDGIRLRGPFKLKGGTFILRDSPDLVPVLGILALFAKGITRLCGISHLRIKESNRMTNFRQELIKLGAQVYEKEDELIIKPSPKLRRNVKLDPHNDHRLAMAFCVLGLVKGAIVKDVECISKSYPAFIKDLRSIGGKFYQA